MMQNLLKALNSSLQILHPPTTPPPHSHSQTISTTHHLHHTDTSPCSKLSRRDLTISGPSLSLLLVAYANVDPFQFSKARADAIDAKDENLNTNGCTNKILTKRAFFDVSIDGEPAGRIVVGLYGADAPSGTTRFSNLVSGSAGISYRRKEFVKIMPNYIQHGGVRSYGVDAELAQRAGRDLMADSLIEEWEKDNERCTGTKNVAGSLGIVVRDPSKPPPKLKLVAREGKLEIDQEEVGSDPNGTEFVIAMKDSPELDSSTLVIGRVVDGMEVVEKINKVKTVQENTTSPYFRVAKLIGDKRAVVAERGFNRPYAKVVVTNCGLID
ncbi:hypothetical protein MRB53_024446 [Persea americana]|uniref:Uncharacterized protein n=1 Tax=Persea americana TaxID=3435 RepID=A0ACC2LDG1_PERAE|nr:hypothetical protein MRB53_024446 [Persea americana]